MCGRTARTESRWRGLETERTYCVTAPVPDPIAGARGQVADGDGQPGLGGERGQLDLPGADPVAVGAAAVGADQQPIGMRVAAPPDGVPPAAQSRHGERGGVVVGAHRHPAGVGRDVVDAVGDRFAEFFVHEVVDVRRHR